MFCPECGNEVPDDAVFCSGCGRMLRSGTENSYDTECTVNSETTAGTTAHGSVFRKGLSSRTIGVIIVVLIIVFVFFVPFDSDEGSLKGQKFYSVEDTDELVDKADARAIDLVSGFDANDATVTLVDSESASYSCENAIKITLSDGIRGTYDTFAWTVNPLSTEEKASTYITSKGSCTLYTDEFLGYRFHVVCSADGMDSASYTFEIGIDCYLYHSWKYDGGRFTVGFIYEHSLVEKYYAKTVHTPNRESDILKFLVIDDAVTDLAERLYAMYEDAYGSTGLNQDLADYVLGYVQIVYDYEYDSVLYKDQPGIVGGEYYAYPTQTIFNRAGDCEDTSLLCAALYHQIGFVSAVLLLPGHAMVGVALSDYEDHSDEYVDVEILYQRKADGRTYYAGETTVSSFQPVGISDGALGYSKYLNSTYTFYVYG